jgi:hypothetical protein
MLSGGADSGSTAMWEQQRQLVQEKQQESDRVKREAHERDTKLAQRRREEQERRDAADQKEAEELQAAFGRPDPLAQRRQEEQRRRDAADQQEAEELQAAFGERVIDANEEELQELQELAKLAERQAPEGMHTTDAVASNQVSHPHTPRHSLPLGAP